jgi:signal transduction histidine kinase
VNRDRPRRHSLRFGLTLVYGALFLAGGVALLAVNYLLVRQSLSLDPDATRARVERRLGLPEGTLRDLAASRMGTGAAVDDRLLLFREIARDIRNEALGRLLVQSGVMLVVVMVVAVVVGWLVAGRLLAPLQRITAAARRLSVANLHERLTLDGPRDELRELAETFDAMLDRLDAAFTSQRRFVADASHELRTPLSIIRAELDVTLSDPDATPEELREMGQAIREAAGRSERLIDGLLALALADSGVAVRTDEQVDLAELAGQALAEQGDLVRARGLRVTSHLRPAPLTGDRALLERLVANLVDNAVRHNQDDGWLSVSTGPDRHGPVLRVANGGPALRSDQVEPLFEPFRRASRDRTGSGRGVGLGLAIVRSITAAHHGAVSARAGDGGGLEVTVRLPAEGSRNAGPADETLLGSASS